MLSCPKAFLSFISLLLVVGAFSLTASAQMSHADQVQIVPPLLRSTDPPAPDATPEALEKQADPPLYLSEHDPGQIMRLPK